MECWWGDFKEFLFIERNISDWKQTLTKPNETFYKDLSDFLFSRRGAKFKRDFKFDGDLKCNIKAPHILVRKLMILYRTKK